mmetsp:Transcript_1751/g.5056  ORF Transcript_1751/g.5056 Transcript_1751/m.5056 type:complete len:232 (+) Transcript_1751:1829-2524(+)
MRRRSPSPAVSCAARSSRSRELMGCSAPSAPGSSGRAASAIWPSLRPPARSWARSSFTVSASAALSASASFRRSCSVDSAHSVSDSFCCSSSRLYASPARRNFSVSSAAALSCVSMTASSCLRRSSRFSDASLSAEARASFSMVANPCACPFARSTSMPTAAMASLRAAELGPPTVGPSCNARSARAASRFCRFSPLLEGLVGRSPGAPGEASAEGRRAVPFVIEGLPPAD